MLPSPVAIAPAHLRGAQERVKRFCRVLPSFRSLRPLGLVGLLVTATAPGAVPAAGDWKTESFGRSRAVALVGSGKSGFTRVAPADPGIRWTTVLGVDRYSARQNLMNGAGIAIGDYDGDGYVDFFVCNLGGPSGLFRNRGDWTFQEVAAEAGVECRGQESTGAVFADVNADGRLDLLVTSFTGPNACLLNLGGGRFTNVTARAGLSSRGGATSMALGDLDGDGDLDLYVCYFGIESILNDGAVISTRMQDGKLVPTGRYARRLQIVGSSQLLELGEADVLYLNDGMGRFAPVRWRDRFRDEEGNAMDVPLDFGLAVQLRDVDLDGDTDIYVCNDVQTPDRFWLNDGKGNFRAATSQAIRSMSHASMGVDFADFDRDGRLDFITVEMLSRDTERHLRQSSPVSPPLRHMIRTRDQEEVARNGLYWNRGDGTYAEIAWQAGLAASDWSWTPIFLDVDLDGFEDLLVSNGHLHDVNDRDVNRALRAASGGGRQAAQRNVLLQFPPLAVRKAAFRNRGDLTFEDQTEAWGFNATNIAHGMALGDLDNDGDPDIILNVPNEPPLVYRNDAPGPRVAVRLVGRAANSQGIGARVLVRGGPVALQMQEVLAGGRYLSADDPQRTFAAGSATNRLTIEVLWPSGCHSLIEGAVPNRIYEIHEPAQARPRNPDPAAADTREPDPLFEDVSARLQHVHVDPASDDFARQPLLPRSLATEGPGVAWVDLDGDLHDDLIVGAGNGQRLAAFRGDGQGGFAPFPNSSQAPPLPADSMGLVGFPQGSRGNTVLVGLSNYELSNTNTPAVIIADWKQHPPSFQPLLPGGTVPAGSLALADVDLDGDLDLFVGGRVIPGYYPRPAPSQIWRSSPDGWVPGQRWESLGLVTGACFGDLDNDGDPDLVVACEWGPLRCLINQGGNFLDRTEALGLSGITGLWTSVTVADLDADGRLDLIAGNWGSNTFLQRGPAGPWSITFGEFGRSGTVACLEGFRDPVQGIMMPLRDLDTLASELPWLSARFTSHAAYAEAGIERILGDRAAAAHRLIANTLASTVFLNRGDRFEPVPLPAEAQWAPSMSVSAGDWNGDGHVDLFLGQNFFDVRLEDERLNTGRGLALAGDGSGRFRPLEANASGILLQGQQRGVAVADFDEDGRLDLVVAEHGSTTRLYRNRIGRPGLRLRLRGSETNPHGVGVRVRCRAGEWLGPAHELKSGTGRLSSDSLVLVLSAPGDATHLEVRWPGSPPRTVEIPRGAREIAVDPDGRASLLR